MGRAGDRATPIRPARGGCCRDYLPGFAVGFLHHWANAGGGWRLAHDLKLNTATPQENIAELFLFSLPTSQSPARCSTFGDRHRVSFYAQASLASSVAISITASTGELCCKEPRFGSHSIRPLGQRTGACLSGSRRIPPWDEHLFPDLRSLLRHLDTNGECAACLLRGHRSAV